MDVVLATAALVFIAPILLLATLAIVFDSGWPVFYRGQRVGLRGQLFEILKFRTMVRDAEAGGSATAHQDARITRVGTFLRQSKIDELPQLFNVLVGEMSLVGPRPEVIDHTSDYTADEQAILSVPPGITDLSSIYFFRLGELLGTDDPDAVFRSRFRHIKNQLRLQYVQARSIGLDCAVLVATATCVLSRGRFVVRFSSLIPNVAKPADFQPVGS